MREMSPNKCLRCIVDQRRSDTYADLISLFGDEFAATMVVKILVAVRLYHDQLEASLTGKVTFSMYQA
jgi:hypothetical protein